MRNASLLLPAVLLGRLAAPAAAGHSPAPYFSGRLTYRTEYQNAAGEPMYYAVPIETAFYVRGGSYKWYDHHQQLQELYQAETNTMYHFAKGQAVVVPDTGARPAPSAGRCLPATATILGYRCQVLRLSQGSVSTLVFYAPELRVEVAAFSRCPSRYWATLLQATDGALPLRTLTVDASRDYSASSQAIAIEPLSLTAADFTLAAPAR